MTTVELLSVCKRLIMGVEKEKDRHRSYLGSEPITFSSCHTGVKGEKQRLFVEDLIEIAELETEVRKHRLV